MPQSRTAPATPFVERLRTPSGRRALGIGLTLLVEALMLLVLLTLGPGPRPGVENGRPTVVDLYTQDVSEAAPAPRSAEPARQSEERPEARQPELQQPNPPQPAPPVTPPMPTIIQTPWMLPPSPASPRDPARQAPSPGPVYGPPDTRSAASRDSERVGAAPNGEPLYAAEWYREPDDVAMRSYLSTARGPGWGLIACRTVADYRVEDCVALSEYPEGSQINRSVLAAAWEFRVRPPRRGGRPLIGSWVRIRIDYGLERARLRQ